VTTLNLSCTGLRANDLNEVERSNSVFGVPIVLRGEGQRIQVRAFRFELDVLGQMVHVGLDIGPKSPRLRSPWHANAARRL
jgi:hypothetical protein